MCVCVCVCTLSPDYGYNKLPFTSITYMYVAKKAPSTLFTTGYSTQETNKRAPRPCTFLLLADCGVLHRGWNGGLFWLTRVYRFIVAYTSVWLRCRLLRRLLAWGGRQQVVNAAMGNCLLALYRGFPLPGL